MENAVEMKDNEGLIGKIYDQWRFECGKSSIRILYQWVFFNGNIIELHGGSSIKMACLILFDHVCRLGEMRRAIGFTGIALPNT